MTAIAIREENNELDVRDAQPLMPTLPSRLTQWANDARQANQVARSLANTAFVPQSLRGRNADPDIAQQITVSQITAAILAGQEVGLEPMAALRSIDIIEGTPGMRAQALRGVVQAQGHEIWVEESTSTRAIVCGQRMGSDKVQKSAWTIDRAKQMGLVGKQNWIKQPTAMLVARATSEVCRWIGGDALLGMPYSAEELADGIDSTETPVAAVAEPETAAPKRRAQRKPVEPPPPVAEPVIEPPTADTPLVDNTDDVDDAVPVSAVPVSPAPAGPPLISDPQMRLMQKKLTEAGHKTGDERRAYIVQQIGRDLDSMKHLTVAEANRVIDSLTVPEEPIAAEQSSFDEFAWPETAQPGGAS
ncbi:hypothetical protein Cme02nite_38580 [Catellatospora methionotrophica]|uniref:RecT family protein n=1 Tax=Catellatospora methionotrophica TaxID=121620 RepID=A0A8J3PFC8_9ACTN|nr:hypothetical protein [Catellatospora methionotrophica]GIG15526.1 hypothetical protein Cme02nite_38580 [Catellatospora methionotrophica]